MKNFLLLLLLLVPVQVYGQSAQQRGFSFPEYGQQPQPPEQPLQQVQEVPAYQFISYKPFDLLGRRERWASTCVLVRLKDGYGSFITASHVLASNDSYIKIGNHEYRVKIIDKWPTGDYIPDGITLVKTTEKIPYQTLKTYFMRARVPKVGDEIVLMGFPQKRYKTLSTIVTEVSGNQFLTRRHLGSGVSGGAAVFKDDGTLAGIIHGFLDTQEGVNTRNDKIYSDMEKDYPFLLKKRASDDKVVVAPEPKPPVAVPVVIPPVEKGLDEDLVQRKIDISLEILHKERQEELGKLRDDISSGRDDSLRKFREESDAQRKSDMDILVGQIRDTIAPINKRVDDMDESNSAIFMEILARLDKREEVVVVVPEEVPVLVPVDPELPEEKDSDLFPVIEEPHEHQHGIHEHVDHETEVPPQVFVPQDKGETDVVLIPHGDEEQSMASKVVSWIPWGTIAGAAGLAGLAIPGGAAGYLGWQAIRYLWNRRKRRKTGEEVGESDDDTQTTAFQGPNRDLSEASQILSLRQYEQREPVLDALRGVLFQDQLSNNPDQPLKDAFNAVNDSFNNIAPITTQHHAVVVKAKEEEVTE